MTPGRLARLTLGLEQRRQQHILHQGRFAAARDPGQTHQPTERNLDIHRLEVVLGGTFQHQLRRRRCDRRELRGRDRFAPGEIVAGEGVRAAQALRLAPVDDPPASLARPRPDVEHAVGGKHHLRIVFDHHQRVAGVAQPLHDADHPAHVARMQADGGFIQHEQGVDQRGAERGGQIDALDLATRQRARLPVEGEIGEADIGQIAQARAHLGEQQQGGLIERRRQLKPTEERGDPLDRQQHDIVHAQTGKGLQLQVRPLRAGRSEALIAAGARAAIVGAIEDCVGVGARADSPEQGVGAQARTTADGAGGVGPVARQQHPDVHLVGLGLEPVEKAPDAIPLFIEVARPVGTALDHPLPMRLRQILPGDVERHAAQLGVADHVGLAFLEALGLPGLDRAAAQASRGVRDDQTEVDTDDPAEAAAGLAGADR